MAIPFTNRRKFILPDFSQSDDKQLQALAAEVHANSEEYGAWSNLLDAVDAQEGGIGRLSSPEAINIFRGTYDEMLDRFPSFFGFWRRYASTEFTIGGTETAEMVYERGVAACPHVIGMWDGYVTFKVDTCHVDEEVRELFERAVEDVGLDFQASDIWDKYLAWEARNNDKAGRYFQLLVRLISLPIRSADKYASTLMNAAQRMSAQELTTPERFQELYTHFQQESGNPGVDPTSAIRDIAMMDFQQTIERTKQEVAKRLPFENALEKPYFLPEKREAKEVAQWVEYLDFEEAQGHYEQIKMLYERTLIVLAYHHDMWFRYARWMLSQDGKKQEVRNIFQRASQIFVPIAEPSIRLQYAYFEETEGHVDIAIDIIDAILHQLPDDLEIVRAHINITRRQRGVDEALAVCTQHMNDNKCALDTKASVLVEAARLTYKVKGNLMAARNIFESEKVNFASCAQFWDGYAAFELEQPSNGVEAGKYERVKNVFNDILHNPNISPQYVKDAYSRYFQYLQDYGTKRDMEEYINIDALIHGSAAVQRSMSAKVEAAEAKAKAGGDKGPQTFNNGIPSMAQQNGAHQYDEADMDIAGDDD